ncbi:MAG: DNA-directed RNA polymerase subunit omega [Bacteroidales bacterium]|nr:DNA-directed RNA polymerase subunit omega [Bacteroidales bacterium]
MDYKKIKTESSTITRDINELAGKTSNIYESVVILSKRSNQVSIEIKEELESKLKEFATNTDNLEEIFENREQIEIAKYYEQLPKPTLIAIHEFLNDQIYFRNPDKEVSEEDED